MVILTVFAAILGGLAGVAMAGLAGLDAVAIAAAYPGGGLAASTLMLGMRMLSPVSERQ